MRRNVIAAGLLALVFALPLGATAQGRHDEKPHATTKPSASASEQERVPATGGRHDSGNTTHGAKKQAAAKKTKPESETK